MLLRGKKRELQNGSKPHKISSYEKVCETFSPFVGFYPGLEASGPSPTVGRELTQGAPGFYFCAVDRVRMPRAIGQGRESDGMRILSKIIFPDYEEEL